MGIELIFAIVFSLGFYSGYNANTGDSDVKRLDTEEVRLQR